MQKNVSLINTTRLIKNSISNSQIVKTRFNPHGNNNQSDRNKDFTSPKFIKRNNSETYKATNKMKVGDSSSHLQYENSKKKRTETLSASKIRVNSAKTSTLSPTKINSSILTKSTSTLKPTNELLHSSEIKIKHFEDIKSFSKIQTISSTSMTKSHSNSSRVKKKVEEKYKESKNINMLKLI